jgi:hypothetical protein
MDLFRGVHQEVDVFISLRMSNTEGSLEEGRDIRRLMIFLIELRMLNLYLFVRAFHPKTQIASVV